MKYFKDTLIQLLGGKPRRPARHEQSEEILTIYHEKRGKLSKADVGQVRHEYKRLVVTNGNVAVGLY